MAEIEKQKPEKLTQIKAAEDGKQELIKQILIKPAPQVGLDENQQLTPAYLGQLQAALPVSNSLIYIRPMSLGIHVLRIEPAVNRELAITVTTALSGRDDVEYAEPDSVRKRR